MLDIVELDWQGLHVPAARPVVEEVIKEWFTLQLMETVITSKSLMRSQFWSPDDIGRLFSSESLTAAVMSRYHIDIAARDRGHSPRASFQ